MNIDTKTYNKAQRYPPDGSHGYGPVVAGGSARRPAPAIRSIVIHTTNGKRGSSLADEASFLYNSMDVSAHYLVGKQGRLIQFLDPEWIAWHTGKVNDPDCGNGYAIGIENHLTKSEQWTAEQRAALTELVRLLLLTYPTITKIVTHRSIAIPAGRKSDPAAWDDSSFHTWSTTLLARQVARPVPYTPNSALLAAPPQVDVPRIIATLATLPRQPYTMGDIAHILDAYQHHANGVGIDWVLAVAQCLHETDRLRSWWAQRPRRNPAGLGVTGKHQATPPSDPQGWVQGSDGIWQEGLSFPSWEQGIQAQLAHLLCYALADNSMTPAQLAFSEKSPRKQLLPASYRGAAHQLIGLNGRWAVPGTTYAQAIATIANTLVGVKFVTNQVSDQLAHQPELVAAGDTFDLI